MKFTLVAGLLLFSLAGKAQNNYDASVTTKASKQVSPFKTINWMDVEKGMRFLVVENPTAWAFGKNDDEIFELTLSKGKEAESYPETGRILYRKDFVGKVFTVTGVKEADASGDFGGYSTFIYFTYGDKNYQYEFTGQRDKLRDGNPLQIQSLVCVDEIDQGKKLFENKDFYIKSTNWNRKKESGEIITMYKDAVKFDKVHIEKIGASVFESNPIRVQFTSSKGQSYFIDTHVSGTNGLLGEEDNTFFYNVFSTNIDAINSKCRKKYWDNIKNQNIVVGMNEDEVQTSLGTPSNVSNIIYKENEYKELYYSSIGRFLFKNNELQIIIK